MFQTLLFGPPLLLHDVGCEFSMVKLLLSIKADLENVTNLQPQDKEFEYFFEVLGRALFPRSSEGLELEF